LFFILRDDPFLRVAVRDAVSGAELVEEVLAADAEVCFLGCCAVVEACVDYLVRILSEMPIKCGGMGEGELVCTSELRLLVSVPGASCRSRRMVDVFGREASWRATARPTTPPPMTYTRVIVSDWAIVANMDKGTYRVGDVGGGNAGGGKVTAGKKTPAEGEARSRSGCH
jgi:hypothetical protein